MAMILFAFIWLALAPGSADAQGISGATIRPEWNSVLDVAKKEGKVIFYSNQVPSVLDRFKADFESAYPGIVMEYFRQSGIVVVGRVDQERQANADGADVVVSTELPWFEQRAKEGQFKAPIGPAAVNWPAGFLILGTVPVLALEPQLMAYNTNMVKTPITGYKDLLAPELKGRIGTLTLNVTETVAWYDWMERTQGAEFMTRLAAQEPRVYASAVPAAQAVASGEIAVTLRTIVLLAQPMIQQGAPLRIVHPNPAFASRYGSGVVAASRRPNAALVLMDYLMSPRGQTMWHGQGASASPLAGIPGSMDAKQLTPWDPSKYTADVVKASREKWSRIFKSN